MTTAPSPSDSVRQSSIAGDAPVRWPKEYSPAHSAIFVHNELVIPAPPEIVWRLLLRAEDWPEWYPNAAHIHFLSHAGPDLRNRSRFRWSTFGVRITSKVLEFEPQRRIAWDAHGIGVQAYHAWILTPTENGSTHLVTEETQNGWLAKLGRSLRPGHLERMHQLWLERLSERAQQLRH